MANQAKMQAVFISGCDSGFGKRLVEMLEGSGRFLVFAGVFTEQGKSLYNGKPNVVAVSLDVTSDASVNAAVDTVKTTLANRNATFFGLVNNAGLLTQPGPCEWQDIQNYERMMAVNLYGVARLTNGFLPLIRRGQGRIVIVASIAGRVGLGLNAAYCASKYAVVGYAEVLRREMIPWKVRVCVVEPGIFGQTGLYGDWQKGLDRVWKNLNPELKADYGEAYYKHSRGVLGYAVKALSNGNPDEVPESVVAALTSPKPLRRYRPGNDSKYMLRVLPLLPDHWIDTIMTRGTPVLPAALKEHTEGHELYANDLTASATITGIITLSSLGIYTIGRTIASRL